MKRIISLLVIVLFLSNINVLATNKNTPVKSNMSESECMAFQDDVKNVSNDGYYAQCVKASCPNGRWRTYYYLVENLVKCNNGNKDYYRKTEKNACSIYSGACTPSIYSKYCGRTIYYDCSRTADGSLFYDNTPPLTTTKPPRTTRPTTTRPKTTKPITTRPPRPTVPGTDPVTTTKPKKSSNNYLEELVIQGQEIEFDKKTEHYFITATKGDDIVLKAIAEDEKAKVKVENHTNIILDIPTTVTVTAENGDERVYVINFSKPGEEITTTKKRTEKLKLKNITINGYKLKFDADVFSYDLKLKEEAQILEIEVETNSENDKVKITGNKNLKSGSKIYIKVSDDKETAKYVINVKKTGDVKTALIVMIISIIFVYFMAKIIYRFIKRPKKELVQTGASTYEYE